jgi:hypothetical protein
LDYDATGKTPYKLICLNLLNINEAKLTIIADRSMNIKTIYDSFNSKTFDEFFLSRLINFENIFQLGNMVDTIVKR